jgi:ElaB/YqjD/DUF883 family membrane-anchored ribosome-binding protein
MALFAQSRRTLQDDIADLSTELARLTRRVSSAASEAGSSASGWLSSNAPSYSDMRGTAEDGAAVVWREAARALDGAETQIRRQPAAAALALLGIGILIGMMARR